MDESVKNVMEHCKESIIYLVDCNKREFNMIKKSLKLLVHQDNDHNVIFIMINRPRIIILPNVVVWYSVEYSINHRIYGGGWGFRSHYYLKSFFDMYINLFLKKIKLHGIAY